MTTIDIDQLAALEGVTVAEATEPAEAEVVPVVEAVAVLVETSNPPPRGPVYHKSGAILIGGGAIIGVRSTRID